MIIIRTPLRISFFGGGSDLPSWYKNYNDGCVLSTSINKYCYIQIRDLDNYFNHKYRIRYFINEEKNNISDISHPVVRVAFNKFFKKKSKGVELIHNADLPARTGLGSSSAFTVSLLHSLYELKKIKFNKNKLWQDSIDIEQNLLKEAVGSQDQIACALGGLNFITFKKKKIHIENLSIYKKKISYLEKNLSLVFLGLDRDAKKIEEDKIFNISHSKNYLNEITSVCNEGKKLFLSNNNNFVKEFGILLNTQWNLKKQLSKKVSNKSIDEVYSWGMKNGAIGGKLLGAGGGGFFLFLSKNEIEKKKLINSFKDKNFIRFKFDIDGSKKIYDNRS